MRFEIRNIIYKGILFPIQHLWEWIGKTEWKSNEYLPYKIWRWWGNRIWFGISFSDRYEGRMNLVNKLTKTFEKLEREKPHLFKDLKIEKKKC